jgi:hypothetical protein
MEDGPKTPSKDRLNSDFEVLKLVEEDYSNTIMSLVTLGLKGRPDVRVYGLISSHDILSPRITFPLGDFPPGFFAKLRREAYMKSTILGVHDDVLFRHFALNGKSRVMGLLGILNGRSLECDDPISAEGRFYRMFGFNDRQHVFGGVYFGGGTNGISINLTSRGLDKLDTVGLSRSERLLSYWGLLRNPQVSRDEVRRQRAEWLANMTRKSMPWLNLDPLSVDDYLDVLSGHLGLVPGNK